MAPVGGTRKVTGSSMATPLTEPRPGMAPTNKSDYASQHHQHQVLRGERPSQNLASVRQIFPRRASSGSMYACCVSR